MLKGNEIVDISTLKRDYEDYTRGGIIGHR